MRVFRQEQCLFFKSNAFYRLGSFVKALLLREPPTQKQQGDSVHTESPCLRLDSP